MKTIKFLAVLVLCICSLSAFAQIKVDASGQIFFGKLHNDKAISIVDETTSSMLFNKPLQLTYKANEMITLSRQSTYGMMFDPSGSILLGYNLPASSNSNTPLEVYGYSGTGGIKVYQNSSYAYPGINVYLNAGSTNAYEARNGSNQVFYVNGNGVVYSTGNQSLSDIRLKSEIETVQNPLDKVLQLRGVTFRMNFLETEEKELSVEESYKQAKVRTPELTPEIWEQIRKEKERKQMGVIAQEIEKVVPEVIRTREDGLKSVAYSELLGLLIEAMKEQQNEIEMLKLAVASVKGESSVGSFRSSTGISEVAQQCVLTQNAPNPFTSQTEIKYFVANGVKNAYICIFDMQGKMLQKINASTGQNSVTVQGSTLQAGIYLYSLVADGQEVDTKRMILTK